jgi:hypothetical protein
MVWWRHAHVVADIPSGIAVFGFAVWAGRNARLLTIGEPVSSERVPPRAP